MQNIVPTYYQKDIRSFERAYVRKQRALESHNSYENQIAKHLGYTDRNEMNREVWSSKDMDSHREKYQHASFILGISDKLRNCMREVQLSNRILDRTKYTFWHYFPKGTPTVNQYGKFTYND